MLVTMINLPWMGSSVISVVSSCGQSVETMLPVIQKKHREPRYIIFPRDTRSDLLIPYRAYTNRGPGLAPTTMVSFRTCAADYTNLRLVS
jgi:hypothetical protein